MDESIALDHPRFRSVSTDLFTRRLVSDCMTHRCAVVQSEDGVPHEPRHRSDVCCQYGADVDLAERDAILSRADVIRTVMRPDAADAPWFTDGVWDDEDYPSGQVVRTRVHDNACIFLAHDRRGCAIHRAALEHGWEVREIKPAICRLFPVSYETDAIVVADEYVEYSCAHVEGPTLYRLARETLGDMFGEALVAALDAAEAQVLAAASPPPRRLPILSAP